MYESYTRQSLPTKHYRELLGSAICVFNSNNAFIIENILKNDTASQYSWYDLIDKTSGQLPNAITATITKNSNDTIANLFEELVGTRNRIMHSFQVTVNNEQILATKDKQHKQSHITEEYLLDFITKNETLSTYLDKFRGY